MTKAKQKKKRDSKTLVYQKLHGGRALLSIRVKPEIKRELLRFCKTNGLSLCHVFEMLATGYLQGMKQKITWVNQSPTIELTVVREVKRIRRYKREYVEGVTVERWFCALKGREYGWNQLPSLECPGCPNVKCREHVIKRVVGRETPVSDR